MRKSGVWLKPEGLAQIRIWAMLGLSDRDIARNMGVSHSILYTWKKKYPEFSRALQQGKELPDLLVEDALYRRSLGYMARETTEISGDGSVLRRVRRQKYIPGSFTAQRFWLENRWPDRWGNPAEPTDEERLAAFRAYMRSVINGEAVDIRPEFRLPDSWDTPDGDTGSQPSAAPDAPAPPVLQEDA